MENLIEINSQFFPLGKLNLICENGFVSSKQIFDALGIRSRQHLPKLLNYENVVLETATRYFKQGNKPEDIVTVLKGLKKGCLSEEQLKGIAFLSDFLVVLVNSHLKDLEFKDEKPKSERSRSPHIIDCDLQPLDNIDFVRREMSITGMLGDDINAVMRTGSLQLYRPDGTPNVMFNDIERALGKIKPLVKGGLMTPRQACQLHPEKLVFDTRRRFRQCLTQESIKQGKLVFVERYDFATPQPWITDDLIIKAENLRSQREREKREAEKLRVKAELEAIYGKQEEEENTVQKPSTPRSRPSA